MLRPETPPEISDEISDALPSLTRGKGGQGNDGKKKGNEGKRPAIFIRSDLVLIAKRLLRSHNFKASHHVVQSSSTNHNLDKVGGPFSEPHAKRIQIGHLSWAFDRFSTYQTVLVSPNQIVFYAKPGH